MASIKKSKSSSKFLQLLEDYWYILVGAIILIPFIVRYLSKQDVAQKSAEEQQAIDLAKVEMSDPVKQQAAANLVTNIVGYQNIARQVAYDLGVNFPWYDPRGWTENDQNVIDALKPLNSGQIKTVGTLYYKCYAVGRSLQDDCLKLLPQDGYNQIRF